VSNLAIEICPNFGKKVPVALGALAVEAKKSIKSSNSIPVKSMTAPHLVGMGRRYYGKSNGI
jgi:hypothetical protein